jgi:hypothetical protein
MEIEVELTKGCGGLEASLRRMALLAFALKSMLLSPIMNHEDLGTLGVVEVFADTD